MNNSFTADPGKMVRSPRGRGARGNRKGCNRMSVVKGTRTCAASYPLFDGLKDVPIRMLENVVANEVYGFMSVTSG